MPEASTLVEEPLNFRVKINLKTTHDSYEAWHEGVCMMTLCSQWLWLPGQQNNTTPVQKKGHTSEMPRRD